MRDQATVVTDRRCETAKAAALTRFQGKRFVGALVIAIGFASNPGSRAYAQPADEPTEASSHLELTWVAPDGCPDLDWVTSEIERLLGRPLASVKEPRTKAAATVTEQGPRKWRLRLVTLQNNKAGERELQAEQCRPLARAAALILALSVDPQAVAAREKGAAGKVEGVQETGLRNPTDEAAATPVAKPQSAPSSMPSQEALAQAPAQKVEPSPDSPPPDSPPAAQKAAEEQPPPPPMISPPEDTAEETPTHTVAIGGAVVGDIGSLPEISFGGSVTAGMELSRWRFEAIASLWPRRQTEVEEVPEYGGNIGLWTLAPGACYRVWTRGLSFAPCLLVEFGRMYGQGTGESKSLTNSRKGAAFWLAPVASARVTWPVNGFWGIVVELGCAIPVLRRRFTLQLNNRTDRVVVHRSAIAAPRARIGMELRF
jgi:hypothetical protein